MSDKFLNSTGLVALRNWIIQKLGLKQDTLVSGTNVKTINNESILGSGNLTINSGLQNLVDGSKTGSVRGINTATEDSSYTIGQYAFAEGYNTKASGSRSHAEGFWTIASGGSSHAEGVNTTASGNNSHAEGYDVQARGYYSHAEGYRSRANGGASHAEGGYSTAIGDYSHAQNFNTIAAKDCQTVIGKYNVEDTETDESKQKAFIIGNGTYNSSTEELDRSNALTVDWSGSVDIASGASYKINGTPLSASDVDAQPTLVSGTNIKTINNESILGSGNIDVSAGGSDVFVATYNVTPIDDIVDAWNDNKVIYYINPDGDTMLVTFCKGYDEGNGSWMEGIGQGDPSEGEDTVMFWQSFNYNTSPPSYSNYSETHIAGAEWVETLTNPATETTLGTIKLNPDESITLNSSGQLDVGGRLGQMSNTTGIYSPKTISPASVGNGSFLLTEGSGQKLGNKSLAVVTGTGLTVKSAAPGATTYLVSNTYENKIICAGLVGGVLTLNESTAAQNYVNITSVTIDGYAPSSTNYWTASGNITIQTDASINPNIVVTSVRPYASGNSSGFSNLFVGQLAGGNGGASIVVGQKVNSASGNANAIVGASMYNTGNGNAMFGRQHINKKNRAFLAGTGHDTTNGPNEGVAALGVWSDIKSDTSFAIGNGTSATNRSNSFEIDTAGDTFLNGYLVLKSPNGTQYRISVSNTGQLVTAAL